ncbi:MAG: hypothetical protein RLZZ342_57 [Candidatus Parcubacteria bacterium]
MLRDDAQVFDHPMKTRGKGKKKKKGRALGARVYISLDHALRGLPDDHVVAEQLSLLPIMHNMV